MGKVRFYIALYAAKFAIVFLKMFRRNATQLPGKLALKISPDFLKYIENP